MKIKISNIGEASSVVIKEVTDEQYKFLCEIKEELETNREHWAPSLRIDIITEDSQLQSKRIAAEIAFESVYHEYVESMSDEAALEEASKVYYEICGEYPNIKDQFGFDWFDNETAHLIETGNWSKNNF